MVVNALFRQGIKNDIFTLDVDPPEYPVPSYSLVGYILGERKCALHGASLSYSTFS